MLSQPEDKLKQQTSTVDSGVTRELEDLGQRYCTAEPVVCTGESEFTENTALPQENALINASLGSHELSDDIADPEEEGHYAEIGSDEEDLGEQFGRQLSLCPGVASSSCKPKLKL